MAISMAFYQAYLCLTCVLMIMYMIKMLLEKQNTKKVFRYVGLCASVIILGGTLYLLITKALLHRADIQMASYKGASNSNLLSMVKYLPQSLKQCYLQFGNYFFIGKASSNLEFIDVVLIGLLVIYLSAAVIQFIKLFKHNIMMLRPSQPDLQLT